jgi:polyhydroxybutyrate depolymerase
MKSAFRFGVLLALSWIAPGQARSDIIVGGARPTTIHVPPGYDGAHPMPLLVFLHGYGGSGDLYESDLARIADEEGFLLAAPDGTPNDCGVPFWNATDACCRLACSAADVDDSAYLRGLVEEARGRLNVDARRVHFFGYSNGGFMSYRMACDHSDIVAAIASFAGATFADPARCAAAQPVHVLQVHGTNDTTIPYLGGSLSGVSYPGALASVEQWVERNGCTAASVDGGVMDLLAEIPGSETTILRFDEGCLGGGSGELWTVAGGTHAFSTSPQFTRSMARYLLAHPKLPVPVARFEATADPEIPAAVILDASASSTPEGTRILRYLWDFGDGAAGEGPTQTHTYARPGRYAIALTIETDDEGRIGGEAALFEAPCGEGDVSPWSTVAIGTNFPASARWESPSGALMAICSGGRVINGSQDSLFFVHGETGGDFALEVRIIDLVSAGPACTVGLMARNSLLPEEPMAAMLLERTAEEPGGVPRFRYRERRRSLARTVSGEALPDFTGWLRLERRGSVLSGNYSADGESWTLVGEEDLPTLGDPMYLGLASAAADAGSSFQALEFRAEGLSVGPVAPPDPQFRRGDVNADETRDISDAITTLTFLFNGAPETLACEKSADTNDDGEIDISDGVALLDYLFQGARAPAEPLEACGLDTTPDDLSCGSFGPCS